jgi:seryl-tRNA(Sec) selenium transferase
MSIVTDRRAFMKWAAALPLLGTIAVRGTFDRAMAAVTRNDKDFNNNIYTRIGVRPLINARGHWTYLSSTLELPEVRAASEEASQYFVDIYELNHAVGQRLAELTGAEFGMITAGVAAAMAAGTAACLAGSDPKKIWQLPDTTGMKSEVVMLGGRTAFDSAIRLAGAKLVIAKTVDELKNAINENTAMVYTQLGDDQVKKALAITKGGGVPLFLDRAGGIPPIEAMSRYAKMGVDLYSFSGGKGLKGPMCSGVLLGRRDLIESAMANYCPWEGAIARPMKVGKEEIMGCLAAIEAWRKYDLKDMYATWTAQLGRTRTLVESVPGVTGEIFIPPGTSQQFPWLAVDWDERAFGLTVQECWRKLREGNPRIEVLINNNPSAVPGVEEQAPKQSAGVRPGKGGRGPSAETLQIISLNIEPGQELIIGKRLRDILKEARRHASNA